MTPTEILIAVITLVIVVAIIAVYLLRNRRYIKMDPPSDVDKAGVPPAPNIPNDDSCWMATAANMLAGAGYGTGNTLQDRAEDIYNDLIAWQTSATNPTGLAGGGWIDTALSWWLASANNTWPNNPYTVVTVLGNKSGPVELHHPKPPWNEPNGARIIANELRRCNMVGLSISSPTDAICNNAAHIAAGDHSANYQIVGQGGHAITCWGDNGGNSQLSNNPGRVRVTDSDRDDGGGDETVYDYDSFTNPNPGGANEGNGWYFNYSPNHHYIKHIAILSPTDNPTDNVLTQKVTGSISLHQAALNDATDLHYEVGTDVDILTYKTSIDWKTENSPDITEDNPRRNLMVEWDLSDKPVPHCTNVTITTEFVLPNYNAIRYSNVGFTYPNGLILAIANFDIKIETPRVARAEKIPNVSGGYLIGAFDIILPENQEVVPFRFVHEYRFDQNPEQHTLLLSGEGLSVKNIRLGHSYGYLMPKDLWNFQKWMTKDPREKIKLKKEPTKIQINWEGRLPYPKGEDVTRLIPDKKSSLQKDFSTAKRD